MQQALAAPFFDGFVVQSPVSSHRQLRASMGLMAGVWLRASMRVLADAVLPQGSIQQAPRAKCLLYDPPTMAWCLSLARCFNAFVI